MSNLREVLAKLSSTGLADVTAQDVVMVIVQAQTMLDRNVTLSRELGDLQDKYNKLYHAPKVDVPGPLTNRIGSTVVCQISHDYEALVTLTFDARQLADYVRPWSTDEDDD